MPAALAPAALLAAGCASAPAPAPASAPATTTTTTTTTAATATTERPIARTVDLSTPDGRVVVAGVTIHQTTDEFRGTEVRANADRLWATLPAVYDQLGLALNGVDSDKRAVATVNLRAQTQLAKVRLSQYIDCGGLGSIGGRAADSYTITFNVATPVVPIGDARSEVRTLVQAFGRPASNSGQPVHCTTTGNLEQKVAELAAAHVTP